MHRVRPEEWTATAIKSTDMMVVAVCAEADSLVTAAAVILERSTPQSHRTNTRHVRGTA